MYPEFALHVANNQFFNTQFFNNDDWLLLSVLLYQFQWHFFNLNHYKNHFSFVINTGSAAQGFN